MNRNQLYFAASRLIQDRIELAQATKTEAEVFRLLALKDALAKELVGRG